MRHDEYASMDAVALSQAVRDGAVAPLEVVDAALAAIDALNPGLNAVVLLDPQRAREAARAVDRRAPLAGVPFLIKDVDVYCAGWPTTHSSRFFAQAAPRDDSEIVRRWRAAGTLLLGKTNSPEFADDFITEPVFRGPTLNPWNAAITVGGSSGGAAAAVASGMVPAAHGSDVGGSIRVPAACCGLFGLKPSRGLNPTGPYFGHAGGGLNCEHVLTRTVRDSAAFLDATAGAEPGGLFAPARPVQSYRSCLDERLEPLRIACLPRRIDGGPVDPVIERALAATSDLLRSLGHQVHLGAYPSGLTAAMQGNGWSLLWMADIALAIEERIAELGRPPEEGELEPLARNLWLDFRRRGALDLLAAQRAAHDAALAMARAFADFDVVLTPVTATLPPAVGGAGAPDAAFDYERWAAGAYAFAPFTELFNVTGQPAASVPVYLADGGLPIGIQLVAGHGRDHLLLQLAAALEGATRWPARHPPIWWGSTGMGRGP